MVPEAALEETEAGLAPVDGGWFVLNACEARWRHRQGRGNSLPFTGTTALEAETYFPQVGINLFVLEPGEPIGMYQWEADPEVAYARFPKPKPTRYRDGWLPGSSTPPT